MTADLARDLGPDLVGECAASRTKVKSREQERRKAERLERMPDDPYYIMDMSPKITVRNLCALEWQSNGHQKEPASAFATYWNRLPAADKELYKSKAAVEDGLTLTITRMNSGRRDGGGGGMADRAQRYPTSPK
ncbi:hypothetical protein EDD22DRAFT_842979 [Suillus occidentalis]|nr:hypothetical protein EDD22DRAFT_842979 [Suillus occidentalis]